MPDLTTINAVTGALIALLTLMGILVGYLRWIRPRWRKFRGDVTGVRDALLGRDPVVDSITGREVQPALPGMGVRMDLQERQMEMMQVAVTKLVDQQKAIVHLEDRVTGVESRVKALEDAAVERVVTRAESVAAWRAMEAAASSGQDRPGDDVVDEPPAGEIPAE